MAVTPPPLITTDVSDPPIRGQEQAVFSPKMDSFLASFNPFKIAQNTLAGWMETVANLVEGWANDADVSATAAALSESAANSAANFKGLWSSLSGALNKPATVLHDGSYWVLLNNLANVASSTPSPSNTDWAFSSGTRWTTPYTASATLAANSQNTIIATSAPADMALPTLATNGFIVLSNSPASTQTVRLMNSAYTIRGDAGSISGGTNITMLAGEVIHLRAVSASILEVV